MDLKCTGCGNMLVFFNIENAGVMTAHQNLSDSTRKRLLFAWMTEQNLLEGGSQNSALCSVSERYLKLCQTIEKLNRKKAR